MRILITESKDFSSKGLESLEKEGFNVCCNNLNYNRLKEKIKNYDGIIIRLGIKIDRNLIDNSNLKFIASPTTGLDHIDLDYAKEKGIKIFSLKGEQDFLMNITSTAELTIGLIIGLLRKINAAFDSVKKNIWNRNLFIGYELKGKTIGIVGLGRLGKIVANLCSAFEMNIIYYDPFVDSEEYTKSDSLGNLFSKSDIISLHLPLNNKTNLIINSEVLNLAKKGAVLVNTSRGELINEEDLISSLENGILSGFACDVLSGEQGKNKFNNKVISYAKKNENVLITPHIGGACKEAMRKTEYFIVQKIIDFYKNGKK